MASKRLVTWNLFFSASAYERGEPVSLEVLEDLSALIDLLCLYEELQVLGDPEHPPFLTHQTPFFDGIRESSAVRVTRPDANQEERLATLTRSHLGVFLPSTAAGELDDWVEHALALSEVPNERERVATMNAAARLNPPEFIADPNPEDVAEALKEPKDPFGLRPFVVRSFMYLAYAELSDTPWAPDAMRNPLMSAALRSERDIASQLRQTLRDQWEKYPELGVVDVRKRVSPFAAIVLERCKGDRTAIVSEAMRLRHELKSIRDQMSDTERDLHDGSRDAATKAARKWTGILNEISQSYGPSPRIVDITSGLGLAEDATEIIEDVSSAKAWVKGLANRPVQAVVRLFRRRPVAHIHRLRAELPASGRLLAALRRVFPETEG